MWPTMSSPEVRSVDFLRRPGRPAAEIPAGSYAFGSHQDINKNGQRDENFLGMPKEPVALSNNALEKMIPTFADAQVAVLAGQENRIDMQLQMYGAKKAKSASSQ